MEVHKYQESLFQSKSIQYYERNKTNMLYVTENSNNQASCTRIIIKFDENDDDKDRIDM